jgi:hypothetical protein
LEEIDYLEGVEDYFRAVRNLSEQPEGKLLIKSDQSLSLGLIKQMLLAAQLQKIAQRALNTLVLCQNLLHSKAQQAPNKLKINNTFVSFFFHMFFVMHDEANDVETCYNYLHNRISILLRF